MLVIWNSKSNEKKIYFDLCRLYEKKNIFEYDKNIMNKQGLVHKILQILKYF